MSLSKVQLRETQASIRTLQHTCKEKRARDSSALKIAINFLKLIKNLLCLSLRITLKLITSPLKMPAQR